MSIQFVIHFVIWRKYQTFGSYRIRNQIIKFEWTSFLSVYSIGKCWKLQILNPFVVFIYNAFVGESPSRQCNDHLLGKKNHLLWSWSLCGKSTRNIAVIFDRWISLEDNKKISSTSMAYSMKRKTGLMKWASCNCKYWRNSCHFVKVLWNFTLRINVFITVVT